MAWLWFVSLLVALSTSLSTAALVACCALLVLYQCLRLPSAPAAPTFHRTLVIGHRGCRPPSPPHLIENTLPALKYALDKGCDGVEIDIRFTKDLVPVVFHDSSLKRLLEGSGYVHDYTYDELRRIKFRPPSVPATATSVSSTSPSTSSSHLAEWQTVSPHTFVPTLYDVLSLVRERNALLLIEVKERRHPVRMARLLARIFSAEPALLQQACVISFQPVVLYALRFFHRQVATCFLYRRGLFSSWCKSGTEDVSLMVKVLAPLIDAVLLHGATNRLAMAHPRLLPWLPALIGASMVGPHDELVCKDDVNQARRHGVVTYVWVVNRPDEYPHFANLGIMIGTDHLFPKASASPARDPAMLGSDGPSALK